jgi:hypothetical protein
MRLARAAYAVAEVASCAGTCAKKNFAVREIRDTNFGN